MQLGYWVPLGKKTYTIVYLHRRDSDGWCHVTKPGSGRSFTIIGLEFQTYPPKGRRFVPPYRGYNRP